MFQIQYTVKYNVLASNLLTSLPSSTKAPHIFGGNDGKNDHIAVLDYVCIVVAAKEQRDHGI
jgi:hypothetical protein